MTTKELDYKLVKDIARIRLVTAKTTEPDVTISHEMKKIMDSLDAAKEPELITEITGLLEDRDCAERIYSIMTKSYISGILQKLNIRSNTRAASGKALSKKAVTAFSASDHKKAALEYLVQTQKAAGILTEGIMENKKDMIVNAAVAEAYGYNMKVTKEMLLNVTKAGLPEDRKNIDIEILGFMGLATEAIEYSEKDKYYDRWIYERFQPIGILKIQVVEP